MYKIPIFIIVILCLIGCQGKDVGELPKDVEELPRVVEKLPIEKKTLSLDTTHIQEVRIIRPDFANLPNKNILVTISDKELLDTLIQILNNVKHKDGDFEDISSDYEIEVLGKDGSSYTLRYWVKFKRIEDEAANNYILDSETSNNMNSFLKTLGIQ